MRIWGLIFQTTKAKTEMSILLLVISIERKKGFPNLKVLCILAPAQCVSPQQHPCGSPKSGCLIIFFGKVFQFQGKHNAVRVRRKRFSKYDSIFEIYRGLLRETPPSQSPSYEYYAQWEHPLDIKLFHQTSSCAVLFGSAQMHTSVLW